VVQTATVDEGLGADVLNRAHVGNRRSLPDNIIDKRAGNANPTSHGMTIVIFGLGPEAHMTPEGTWFPAGGPRHGTTEKVLHAVAPKQCVPWGVEWGTGMASPQQTVALIGGGAPCAVRRAVPACISHGSTTRAPLVWTGAPTLPALQTYPRGALPMHALSGQCAHTSLDTPH